MGYLPPPDSKDGLQGALFNLWTPDRAHKHHQPNTTHLDPTAPKDALDVAGDLSSWDFPSVDQVLWVGKGAVGRVGLWEGDAAQALFADPPRIGPGRPPHVPLPPHLPLPVGPGLRPRRHGGRRAMHALFVGSVVQMEVCKGHNADAESEIHFAMTGIGPPERPTTLWHLANTAPAWRSPKCAKSRACAIPCPCECKVCFLVCLLCLVDNWTKFT